MTVKSWFPTFLYYADLQKNLTTRLNSKIIEEAQHMRRVDKAGQKWCEKNYLGGYTSYGSYSNLHQRSSTFIDLEKKIRKHVYAFANSLEMDLQGKTLRMVDFWVNIMPHQVVHSLHIHPLSVISGTYYVQTPRDGSGIKFEDPRLSKFMAAPPKKKGVSEKNRQYVEYRPKAGKVVLFESWLRHEVPPNPSKDERISVSFNYGWF